VSPGRPAAAGNGGRRAARRWLTGAVLAIAEVDPQDEAALRAWYEALHAGAAAGRTAPVIASWTAFAHSLQQPGDQLRRIPVAARRDGEVVGALLVEFPLREDLGTAMVEVDVPPPHRGQGVGRALGEWAAERVAAAGRTVVQAEVHVPAGRAVATWPGARFAAAFGLRSEHAEDHLVLDLPATTGPVPETPGYRLVSWRGACPAELVDAYAALWSAMSGDVPTGGLIREAARWDADRIRANEERLLRSYDVLVTMALTTQGAPAGYTLVYADRSDPDNAQQDDTLVLAPHRGHRLGLRLKQANLTQLDAGRRRLHTWTAPGNAPMQRVNARFGFRLVERTHEYQLTSGALSPGADRTG